MTGKLSPELLKKYVLGFKGASNPRIMSGPGIGEDAAVIENGPGRYLLVSSDPIVGAEPADMGRFAVEVNLNDIAVKGGTPQFLILTILVPEALGPEYVGRVMADISSRCGEYGIAVIGGHTEFSDQVKKPIVSATIIGETDRLYTMDHARRGDKILIAGGIALEGTYLIVNKRKTELTGLFTEEELSEVDGYIDDLSVYKTASLIKDTAVFMHDPTEGGIMGGLTELAELSGKGGIRLYDDIVLRKPVERLTSALGIDPLKLISSGALMAVIPGEKAGETAALLEKNGIEYQYIGEIAEENNFEPSFHEELWSHI